MAGSNEALAAAVHSLDRARISEQRLGDLQLGSVGITLNPHFLLDDQGNRTRWLVKRLRARRFADPLAKFREFESDHRLLERYFADDLGGRQVLETAFVVVAHNFDAHPDYEPGREYVMVQEYVTGTSLQEAAQLHGGNPPEWLRRDLQCFVDRYRRLQARELAIPDCFSARSEHVKVEHARERVVLIDTNNVVLVRRDLSRNGLFQRYCARPLDAVRREDLHDVFRRVCTDYRFDHRHLHSPRPDFSFRDARELEQLVRYFPELPTDNQYLREVCSCFGLEGA